MYNLKNKTVIITGASSGIGAACAEVFSNKGANVVLAARNTEGLNRVAYLINSRGGQALAVKCDVSVEAECKNLIEACVAKFGGVDVLINNAGLSMRADFADLDIKVLKKLMDVNFWGTVYCTKYAFNYLLKSKGSVVGISSVAGIHGLPGRTGYSASKFAMDGFLQTIRVENLKTGLHVMTVIPGFVATNVRLSSLVADGSAQGESPRNEDKMMTAAEAAKCILRGVEKRKRQVVTSYEGKLTPLLNILFPRWLDKMYYDTMKKEPVKY